MKEGLWDTDAGAFTISALASANGSSDGCSTDAFTSLSTSTIGERCGCLSMRCFCPLFLRRVRDCDILAGLNNNVGGCDTCQLHRIWSRNFGHSGVQLCLFIGTTR